MTKKWQLIEVKSLEDIERKAWARYPKYSGSCIRKSLERLAKRDRYIKELRLELEKQLVYGT